MACPLETFFLGLISTQLLWKGVISAILPGYDLKAPDQVLVEEGLCAMIPCNFTYKKEDARKTAILKGFWRKGGEGFSIEMVNSSQTLAQNRFQIIGNLTAGNCSLLILNAQKKDTGNYFFRMMKDPRAYFSFYSYAIPHLNVTERRLPKVQILPMMTEGNSTNITCATFASCSSMPPKFTWSGFSKYFDSYSQLNGTQVYSLVVNFLPSAADHKRNITCTVNYANENNTVLRETTVQLNVIFKPQMLGINVEHFHSNKSQENFTNISQLSVHKGDCIQLRCNVNSNPSSNVTWVKETQNLNFSQDLNVLQLSDLKIEDAGTYTCHAANEMGFGKTSFELFVTDSRKTLLLIVSGTLIMLAVIVLITGIILASKRYRRKKKRVIKLEAGNTLTNAKKPNTSDLAAQEVNGVLPKPRSTHESVNEDPGDPEEIHYATLSFNVSSPQPDITAEEVTTDYAEIRLCNS